MWSHRDPALPEMPMELGGQGFSELQQNVYGLCTKELSSDLTVVDCPAFSLGPQLQYQRRHRFPYKAYSPMPPGYGGAGPAFAAGTCHALARLAGVHRAILSRRTAAAGASGSANSGHADRMVHLSGSRRQAITDYYPDIVPYFLMDGEKYDDPFNLLLDVILSGSSDVNTAFVNLAAEVQKNGASSAAFTQMNALQSLLRTVKIRRRFHSGYSWLLECFRDAGEFGSVQHDRLRVIRVFVHG